MKEMIILACSEVIKLIEEYIMGELDTNTQLMVEEHLNKCSSCNMEYHEKKDLIVRLQTVKKSIQVKEDILDMAKKNVLANIKKRNMFKKSFSNLIAGVFFVLFLITSSLIMFPAFAVNYMPELPVIKQVKEAQEIKKENEQLRMAIKEINGTKVKEFISSEGIEPSDNDMIQKMAISFIKAQYKEDVKAAMEMCTEEYKKELEKNNGVVLENKKGDIVFSTITNAIKEGEIYMVFVRVSDGLDTSEYQWNFEFKKVDEKFLISFIGLNA